MSESSSRADDSSPRESPVPESSSSAEEDYVNENFDTEEFLRRRQYSRRGSMPGEGFSSTNEA